MHKSTTLSFTIFKVKEVLNEHKIKAEMLMFEIVKGHRIIIRMGAVNTCTTSFVGELY